ncbi:GatB/YqeY domain-containing protein [Seleniivibrio sp.]|uniref:GatB/YqeY domain-containing protein n=1 Tax=Seleniivibrio sp. TaxID=2898801 RepID=UPI0025FE5EB3|nr:GatB/YqeY domain-containing protein [Seleniivibrio sp.]MCD8552907.1 GatB/YqeY domain-containing protein [Seleniivibrio sp.]
MSLKERITEDMKTFMKEKNQLALDTVRMLRAEIKNTEIDAKAELDDAGVQKVIASAMKKRRDAADQYKAAGREDLADKELAEAKFLAGYMPEQMSEDEIKAVVKAACEGVDTSDKKNFGKVMQTVMAKTAGKADGKIVNQLVKDAFDGNN